MHCSIAGVKQDYGATGILYDVGSVYEGLCKLTDIRKAQGKLYRSGNGADDRGAGKVVWGR